MRPGRYPQLTDGKWLRDQYVAQQKSTVQIANEVGCTPHLVGYRLQQHRIPARARGGGAITQWSPKSCDRCGKEFTPNGPASKFCAACRSRRRPDTPPRSCTQCGTSFAPGGPNAKYCSRECLNASKRYGHRPRLCERCGTEFQPSGPAARYCSAVCRVGTRSCEQCGKVFGLMVPERTPDRSGTWTSYQRRFCSDGCQVAWRSANMAHRSITSQGYVEISVPPTLHRNVNDNGYVRINLGTGRYGRGRMLEHRWVMEQRLGRNLTADETVHHKRSGSKLDNDRCPQCPADTLPPRVVEEAGKERLHCEACGWQSGHAPNLELWSGRHPKGQRVTDLVEYALEILDLYAPNQLARKRKGKLAAVPQDAAEESVTLF